LVVSGNLVQPVLQPAGRLLNGGPIAVSLVSAGDVCGRAAAAGLRKLIEQVPRRAFQGRWLCCHGVSLVFNVRKGRLSDGLRFSAFIPAGSVIPFLASFQATAAVGAGVNGGLPGIAVSLDFGFTAAERAGEQLDHGSSCWFR
jgi:hypothetical protein